MSAGSLLFIDFLIRSVISQVLEEDLLPSGVLWISKWIQRGVHPSWYLTKKLCFRMKFLEYLSPSIAIWNRLSLTVCVPRTEKPGSTYLGGFSKNMEAGKGSGMVEISKQLFLSSSSSLFQQFLVKLGVGWENKLLIILLVYFNCGDSLQNIKRVLKEKSKLT